MMNTSEDRDGDFQSDLGTFTSGYVPLWTQVIYFIYVATIFVCGTTGNLVIIIVYARTKPKKPCDWFILFIGITDFTVSIVAPALCVHMELAIVIPYINALLCGIEHLWQLAAMSASCFILTIMSIERFIRVCHPSIKTLTARMSRNISIVCIVLALGISIYPSFQQFRRDRCFYLDSVDLLPFVNVYIYFAIFMLCFITVAYAYGRIIYTIEQKVKVKQRLFNNSGLHPEITDSVNDMEMNPMINAFKENHSNENINVSTNDNSDKNDSGFNQIEMEEMHNRADNKEPKGHSDATPHAATNGSTAGCLLNETSADLAKGDNDDQTPDTGRESDHNCFLASTSQLSQASKASNSNLNNDFPYAARSSDIIHITENPMPLEYCHQPDPDPDFPLAETMPHKSSNHNRRKSDNSGAPRTNTHRKAAQSDSIGSVGSFNYSTRSNEKYLRPGSAREGSFRQNQSASNLDTYSVDDDLYSDIPQTSDFFQKAKKAMHEFQGKKTQAKKRTDQSRRKRWIRERQVTLMLVSVTAVFLGTWLPPWILYLIINHRVYLFPSGVATRIFYRHVDKMFLLNYISNFPIYYRFNTSFRLKAKKVIPRWARRYFMCWCLHNLDKNSSEV